MGKRDDYKLHIRKKWFADSPEALDFTDDALDEALVDAIDTFSRCKPRTNRLGNVVLTTTSRYAKLPDDFMSAELNQLWYGITGIKLDNLIGYRYVSAMSVFDSELAATLNVPPGTYPKFLSDQNGIVLNNLFTQGQSFTIKLSSEDDSGYSILLPGYPVADVTREIEYDAFHIMDDTRNTIPKIYQSVVDDLTISEVCNIMARKQLSTENPTQPRYFVEYWLNMSKSYTKAHVRKLSVLGGRS